MAIIAITRLRVRSPEFVEDFFTAAINCAEQAQGSSGHLASDFLGEANDTYWTASAWDDVDAMRRYTASGIHRETMPHLKHWCDEATVLHWEQVDTVLPSWAEAHRRLAADGKVSYVEQPSADHASRNLPAPADSAA